MLWIRCLANVRYTYCRHVTTIRWSYILNGWDIEWIKCFMQIWDTLIGGMKLQLSEVTSLMDVVLCE